MLNILNLTLKKNGLYYQKLDCIIEKLDFIAMNEKIWKNAMVIYARFTNLYSIEPFRYEQVQSRFLVWCESGKGWLIINNQRIAMTPGKLVFAPWNHSISWIGNPEEPLSTGTIHIIPDMPEENPPRYSPFHSATPELPEFFARKDEFLPEFPDITEFDLPLEHPFFHLARYVVNCFQEECPEFILRLFPRQLLYELYSIKSGKISFYPDDFKQIVNTVEHYLEDHLDIKMLCRVSNLSISGVYRSFNRLTGKTPGQYINERRLKRASELLRTTDLSVQTISRRLQYKDPFYFSRCFKHLFGVSPRQWRNNASIPLPPRLPQRQSFSQRDIPGEKHHFFLPSRELM